MSKSKNPYLKIPDLPQRLHGHISSDGYQFKGVLFDNYCPTEETGTDHDWSFICKDCQKNHQQLAVNIDAGDGREYECGVSGCSATSTEVMSLEHLIEQLKASIKQATYISIDGGKSFVKVYHVDDQRLDEHEDTQTGIDYEEEDGYTGSYYFSQVAQACRRGQLQIKKLVDVEVPLFEEKHIDVDEWLCEVVTRAPHIYATTSETKALIKKDKEHYAIVSIPKSVNLSPMAGNSIHYFSSSAAKSFPDKTVRLIELADAEELNSNYVLDFDKYDFFIAERIGKQ